MRLTTAKLVPKIKTNGIKTILLNVYNTALVGEGDNAQFKPSKKKSVRLWGKLYTTLNADQYCTVYSACIGQLHCLGRLKLMLSNV